MLSKEHTPNGLGSAPGMNGETPAPNTPNHGPAIHVERVFVCWGSKSTPTSEKTSNPYLEFSEAIIVVWKS